MIQLRKNPFSETSINVDFIEGELLSSLVDRVILENNYELTPQILNNFNAVVNGHIVEKDMWSFVEIKETDTVLVAPRIARGEGAQLFKQIAIIAIAVAAAAFGQAEISSPLLAAAFTAGVTIGATLALNALIPPPGLPGLGGLGSDGSSFEGSQMYTITSQTNNAKKFGYVPKVYGSHRIFPLIAANPYTELEADPDTGTIVQYFYGVYDFGFGPAQIDNVKIGETLLADYENAEYRLVDFNKPAVSEGTWDDALHDSLTFYKGDVERDGTVVALDENQSEGGPLDDYQATRNASSEVRGDNQEIILDFVCPQGLIAYNVEGFKIDRTIELQIEFSKADEDVWRGFNDINYVYDYQTTGGQDNVYRDLKATALPIDILNYTLLYQYLDGAAVDPLTLLPIIANSQYYGYPKGTTQIPLLTTDAQVGDAIYSNGNFVGKVASITSHPVSGYSNFVLEVPTTIRITIFQYNFYQDIIGGPVVSFAYVETSILNKFKVRRLSLGTARVVGKSPDQLYFTFKFKPREITAYKVRITRVNSTSGYLYATQDRLTLASLATRFDRNPIVTDKRHVFIEIRIRATNQLNGAIQNLSGEARSVLDVWNGSSWEKQITNNPAWVFCDLMTGELNKRAISKDRLHLNSIVEWANFCDEVPDSPPSQDFTQKRFACDFVLDFDTTLQAIISNITSAAQASLNIIDGKYGVLVDKLKTVPVQIFTPRNSWDFSSTRNYSDTPHAIKVKYVEPNLNWDVTEIVIYDDGYDEETATIFDELSTFACIKFEQAWRFGRYMLAQSRLRKEQITISVDFEHIVCTRGDFVQITQDVMKVGGSPARVKSVVGTVITIDDGIDTDGMLSYGYVTRAADGTVNTSTLTVIDAENFDLDGVLPEVGDLIVIGEVGSIVMDCLVKSISPNSDMSATLVLVEKADAVYDAESTDTIPPYDPQISRTSDSKNTAPSAVENLIVTDNDWRVIGGAYQYFIDLDWDQPTGSAYETFEIYVDSGAGYKLVDFTNESNYEYIVDPDFLDIQHNFKVLAVSAYGKKINLIEATTVSDTPLNKVDPPSDVDGLTINITNQVLTLDWNPILDADVKEYILRYTPVLDGATWEASIPILRTNRDTTLASVQGRVGTYFIKASDLNGNVSTNAATALTTIPSLFDLNVIEETNDFPDLEGELVTTVSDGTALTIKTQVVGGVNTNTYYSEGFYYYKDFLDLGEIYSVRIQSLIKAEGFTVGDLMSNWPDLSSLLAMSNAGVDDWDVETHYRTTDSFNVMSDWTSLDIIDPISEGAQDNWTAWKKFTIGDATGRIFQFRLRLISNLPSVTPRVFDGVIRSDMPDRTESYENQLVPDTGLSVVYMPAFKGPDTTPNIQVTQDSASQGDYFIISSKTLEGFTIIFYDKDDNPVVRQADFAIKGFGRRADAVI